MYENFEGVDTLFEGILPNTGWSLALPMLPHEIDAHPDAARIWATIEAEASKHGADVRDRCADEVNGGMEDLEEQVSYLEATVDAYLEDKRDVERELDQEREDHARTLVKTEALAKALLSGDRGRIKDALEAFADVMLSYSKINAVEAAELEGVADWLAAPQIAS